MARATCSSPVADPQGRTSHRRADADRLLGVCRKHAGRPARLRRPPPSTRLPANARAGAGAEWRARLRLAPTRIGMAPYRALVHKWPRAYPGQKNSTRSSMARGERINPPGVHTPQANYSHVTRVGDTLYISGQLPLDATGNLVGAGQRRGPGRAVLPEHPAHRRALRRQPGRRRQDHPVRHRHRRSAARGRPARPYVRYAGPVEHAGGDQRAGGAGGADRDRGYRGPGLTGEPGRTPSDVLHNAAL